MNPWQCFLHLSCDLPSDFVTLLSEWVTYNISKGRYCTNIFTDLFCLNIKREREIYIYNIYNIHHKVDISKHRQAFF